MITLSYFHEGVCIGIHNMWCVCVCVCICILPQPHSLSDYRGLNDVCAVEIVYELSIRSNDVQETKANRS